MAVDQTRLQDLDEAVRDFLAWESILNDQDTLDLSPHQVKQAETRKGSADSTVNARLPEAYQWLLVPTQPSPNADVEWQAFKLSGQEELAVRCSKKLRNEELLLTALAGTRLRLELDRIPLWRGDHVSIRQLVDDFAKYLYLPRLQNSSVLINSVRDGLRLPTWQKETFAYADGYDDAGHRYRGLRSNQPISLVEGDSGLLVRPDVAQKQLDAEARERASITTAGQGHDETGGGDVTTITSSDADKKQVPKTAPKPRQFHGTVELDPARVGRDAGRIADEVLSHLTGIVGAQAHVTLEIDVEIPTGIPEDKVQIVNENANTLKFKGHGFEEV